MDVIAYAGGIILFLVLSGLGVAAALSSSDGKRKEARQTRHIANQPWDARSADGRGNR